MRTWLTCFALSLSLSACGDDGNSTATDAGDVADADPNAPDAMPTIDSAPPADACTGAPDLAPQGDSGTATNIHISEISFSGDYVELFNSGDSDVDLTGLGGKWCSYPSYANVSADNITVPSKGYATIPVPTTGISEAAGEIALYADASYSNEASVLDYVCWGANQSGPTGGTNPETRKDTAENAGKWSGGCANEIPTGGALRRITNTAGTSAADYETLDTPDPTNCGP